MNGQGTLTIRTMRENEGMIRVEIGDDGPGIPEDIVDRIFTPFFTTKPFGEGTGLGLDLAWRIVVEKHHGNMSVQSQPGGYQVHRLPAAAAPAPPEIPGDDETRSRQVRRVRPLLPVAATDAGTAQRNRKPGLRRDLGGRFARGRPAWVDTLLEATDTLQVATGIVNIWTAAAGPIAESFHRIEPPIRAGSCSASASGTRKPATSTASPTTRWPSISTSSTSTACRSTAAWWPHSARRS